MSYFKIIGTNLPSVKQTYFFMALSAIGMMGYALYTQYYLFLEPCPLCMTQRLFYILIITFSLLALLHNKQQRAYGALTALSAAGGASFAGRQVWLQHLPPDQVPACGPSLQYMLETFPLSDALMTMIRGDGNCAEVVWTFIGFSMGEWSLFCFTGFLIVASSMCLRK